MMKEILSRREFLKNSGKIISGAALMAAASPVLSAVAEAPQAPAHPYPYVELDAAAAEKVAYEGYFEDGCCYGVAKGLLAELSAKVGFPYTMIPAAMFANGKEGYTCGTLCGALGGAVGVIGLCCAPADARKVTAELIKWYTTTALPIYQPAAECPVQTVSPSANCLDSITTFMKAANVERADPIRKRRCGGLSGDVARKTVELLNIHYGYAEAPVAEEAAAPQLAANEYIGVGQGFGGEIKVKVTMDGSTIAKVEVLSHNETPGLSDASFAKIPEAIKAANSVDIDAASMATTSLTNKGIIEAVKNALAQVK